ncbi:AsnC family protein [Pseudosporangium ferrugineum]|uniref:Uncharacterized protein n=1 Tax=Pseudosporangium ferrugineum TaxID=439699 RepID=A0A2T0RSG6_9ACTN|nr:AsnC family protein [Pseudosporangium ferrugineum]PRY24033.1 hypothetical protein CLV70_114166 [Pseudosporangium ferrugineum]
MIDNAINAILSDWRAILGGALLALAVVIVIGRKVRNSKAGKIADKLVGPVMFAGMIWSADAVWILTGPQFLGLPAPLRIAMFAVLEFALLVAMLRAKDSMDRIGRTGAHGGSAWLIASLIALFGFVLGLVEGGLVVAVFRPIIPLVLTKLWWDGVLGDSPRKAGSFKWTPRKLLILMGAIDADDRDVKTVNRDRLIQRMTDLYYDSLYGPEGKRQKLRTRLARLTLDADEEIIREVMRRVRRTQWTTAAPLPYDVTQHDDATVTQPVTQSDAARDARVAVSPARRVKHVTQALTSGDATDADPATQAASLVLTQGLSTREAARKVGGVSPSTVLRRVEKLRDATGDAPLTQNPINGQQFADAAK